MSTLTRENDEKHFRGCQNNDLNVSVETSERNKINFLKRKKKFWSIKRKATG